MICSNLIRRRPRGFRKRPNLKGSGGGRFDHHVPAAAVGPECAPYVGDHGVQGSSHHRGGRGSNPQITNHRYTPYDVPTGVLSPPPDYGNFDSLGCCKCERFEKKILI